MLIPLLACGGLVILLAIIGVIAAATSNKKESSKTASRTISPPTTAAAPPSTTATTIRPGSCALDHGSGAIGGCWDRTTGIQGWVTSGNAASSGGSVYNHVNDTTYDGQLTITAKGTTVAHETINGCVQIDADDVTFTDVMIVGPNTCSDQYFSDTMMGDHGRTGITLDYVTFVGNGATTCMILQNATLNHVNASSCIYEVLTINAGHLTMNGSYLHDNGTPNGATGSHIDAFRSWGTVGTHIYDSWIANGPGPPSLGAGSGYTSAVFCQDYCTDYVISGSYIEGSKGQSGTCGQDFQGPLNGGVITITDNVLSSRSCAISNSFTGNASVIWTNNHLDTLGGSLVAKP